MFMKMSHTKNMGLKNRVPFLQRQYYFEKYIDIGVKYDCFHETLPNTIRFFITTTTRRSPVICFHGFWIHSNHQHPLQKHAKRPARCSACRKNHQLLVYSALIAIVHCFSYRIDCRCQYLLYLSVIRLHEMKRIN